MTHYIGLAAIGYLLAGVIFTATVIAQPITRTVIGKQTWGEIILTFGVYMTSWPFIVIAGILEIPIDRDVEEDDVH